MTTSELIRDIETLSSGTIASIFNVKNYECIDKIVNEWIEFIILREDYLKDCQRWQDAYVKFSEYLQEKGR